MTPTFPPPPPESDRAYPSVRQCATVVILLCLLSTAASLLNLDSWRAGGVTIMWPSNGFLLGVLLCSPRRYWAQYLALGYVVDLWLGVYTPATVPPEVLAKLNAGIAKALKDEQLKASFATFGLTPRGTTLAEGAAFTKSEYEKWRKVIDDGHITLD